MGLISRAAASKHRLRRGDFPGSERQRVPFPRLHHIYLSVPKVGGRRLQPLLLQLVHLNHALCCSYAPETWEDSTFSVWIDSILQLAQEAGLNTVRVTNWLGQPGPYQNMSSPLFTNIDHLMQKALSLGCVSPVTTGLHEY